MADESIQKPDRRKRVQRMKRYIIASIGISLMIPTLLCIYLLVQVNKLNKSLLELEGQLQTQNGIATEQTSGGTGNGANSQPDYQQTGQIIGELPGTEDKTGEGQDEVGTNMPESKADDAETEMVGDHTEEEQNPGQAVEPDTQQEAVTAKHKVYLTFDDGPSSNTYKILDILDEYGVKATFFVVGKTDEKSKEAILEIIARGHTLGMHSYTHDYSEIYKSETAFENDFYKLRDYLNELTDLDINLYRFPGGSSNKVSKVSMKKPIAFLNENNIRYFDWNISSGDADSNTISSEAILKNATTGIDTKETSVILMHDAASKKNTVAALPQIIETILAMEDTVILPISDDTDLVQHLK